MRKNRNEENANLLADFDDQTDQRTAQCVYTGKHTFNKSYV